MVRVTEIAVGGGGPPLDATERAKRVPVLAPTFTRNNPTAVGSFSFANTPPDQWQDAIVEAERLELARETKEQMDALGSDDAKRRYWNGINGSTQRALKRQGVEPPPAVGWKTTVASTISNLWNWSGDRVVDERGQTQSQKNADNTAGTGLLEAVEQSVTGLQRVNQTSGLLRTDEDMNAYLEEKNAAVRWLAAAAYTGTHWGQYWEETGDDRPDYDGATVSAVRESIGDTQYQFAQLVAGFIDPRATYQTGFWNNKLDDEQFDANWDEAVQKAAMEAIYGHDLGGFIGEEILQEHAWQAFSEFVEDEDFKKGVRTLVGGLLTPGELQAKANGLDPRTSALGRTQATTIDLLDDLLDPTNFVGGIGRAARGVSVGVRSLDEVAIKMVKPALRKEITDNATRPALEVAQEILRREGVDALPVPIATALTHVADALNYTLRESLGVNVTPAQGAVRRLFASKQGVNRLVTRDPKLSTLFAYASDNMLQMKELLERGIVRIPQNIDEAGKALDTLAPKLADPKHAFNAADIAEFFLHKQHVERLFVGDFGSHMQKATIWTRAAKSGKMSLPSIERNVATLPYSNRAFEPLKSLKYAITNGLDNAAKFDVRKATAHLMEKMGLEGSDFDKVAQWVFPHLARPIKAIPKAVMYGTAQAPARFIRVGDDSAIHEIQRMARIMPDDIGNDMLNRWGVATTVAEKRHVVVGAITQMFKQFGVYDTEEGARWAGRFIQQIADPSGSFSRGSLAKQAEAKFNSRLGRKAMKRFAPQGHDLEQSASGIWERIAITMTQTDEMFAIPDMKKLIGLSRRMGMLERVGLDDKWMFDQDFWDFAIHRIWSPSVLLRLGFPIRAGLDEYITFLMREGVTAGTIGKAAFRTAQASEEAAVGVANTFIWRPGAYLINKMRRHVPESEAMTAETLQAHFAAHQSAQLVAALQKPTDWYRRFQARISKDDLVRGLEALQYHGYHPAQGTLEVLAESQGGRFLLGDIAKDALSPKKIRKSNKLNKGNAAPGAAHRDIERVLDSISNRVHDKNAAKHLTELYQSGLAAEDAIAAGATDIPRGFFHDTEKYDAYVNHMAANGNVENALSRRDWAKREYDDAMGRVVGRFDGLDRDYVVDGKQVWRRTKEMVESERLDSHDDLHNLLFNMQLPALGEDAQLFLKILKASGLNGIPLDPSGDGWELLLKTISDELQSNRDLYTRMYNTMERLQRFKGKINPHPPDGAFEAVEALPKVTAGYFPSEAAWLNDPAQHALVEFGEDSPYGPGLYVFSADQDSFLSEAIERGATNPQARVQGLETVDGKPLNLIKGHDVADSRVYAEVQKLVGETLADDADLVDHIAEVLLDLVDIVKTGSGVTVADAWQIGVKEYDLDALSLLAWAKTADVESALSRHAAFTSGPDAALLKELVRASTTSGHSDFLSMQAAGAGNINTPARFLETYGRLVPTGDGETPSYLSGFYERLIAGGFDGWKIPDQLADESGKNALGRKTARGFEYRDQPGAKLSSHDIIFNVDKVKAAPKFDFANHELATRQRTVASHREAVENLATTYLTGLLRPFASLSNTVTGHSVLMPGYIDEALDGFRRWTVDDIRKMNSPAELEELFRRAFPLNPDGDEAWVALTIVDGNPGLVQAHGSPAAGAGASLSDLARARYGEGVWFHGTSKDAAQSASYTDGLMGGGLTRDIEEALSYAGDDGVIAVIRDADVPESFNRLGAVEQFDVAWDADSYERIMTSGEDVGAILGEGLPVHDVLTREMLASFGDAKNYDYIIPRSSWKGELEPVPLEYFDDVAVPYSSRVLKDYELPKHILRFEEEEVNRHAFADWLSKGMQYPSELMDWGVRTKMFGYYYGHAFNATEEAAWHFMPRLRAAFDGMRGVEIKPGTERLVRSLEHEGEQLMLPDGGTFKSAVLAERRMQQLMLVIKGRKNSGAIPEDIVDDLLAEEFSDLGELSKVFSRSIERNEGETTLSHLQRSIEMVKGAEDNHVQLAVARGTHEMSQWIDSIPVRSFAQEVGRNLAPFAWAQERFLKRATKTLITNPAALKKLQLAWAGAHNMGVIQENSRGEKIFYYPPSLLHATFGGVDRVAQKFGLSTSFQHTKLARATGKVSQVAAGIENPLQQGVQPFIGLPIKALVGFFPELHEPFAKVIGDQALSETDDPTYWGFLPSSVTRVLRGINAEEAAGTAVLKSLAAMNYLGLDQFDEANQDAHQFYIDEVVGHTRNLLFAQAALGWLAPASPAFEYAHEGLRTEYIELIGAFGPVRGIAEFQRRHPDATAATVSITDSPGKGNVESTKTIYNQLIDNENYWSRHAWTAPYLLERPTWAEPFDSQTWATIRGFGIRNYKTNVEMLRDLKFAQAAPTYFHYKDERDVLLGQEKDPARRAQIRNTFSRWQNEVYFPQNPMFRYVLQENLRELQRSQVVDSMESAFRDGADYLPDTPRLRAHKEMTTFYRDYERRVGALANLRGKEIDAQRAHIKLTFAEWAYEYQRSHPEVEDYYRLIIRPSTDFTEEEIEEILGYTPPE